MAPFARILLLILVVASVFGTALLFAGERLWAKIKRRSRPYSRIELAAYTLAVIGILCILDGLFIEPYHPQVTRVTISTPKFAHGSLPVRIVHISDLHVDPRPRADAKIAALIRAEHPDLICFTGDAVNEEGKERFRTLMRDLAHIAPVYAVRGNWDRPAESASLYQDLPVTLLAGRTLSLHVNGQDVLLAGVHADEIPRIASRYPAETTVFKLLLYHYPDAIEEAKAEQIDVYLAGHTHGGQVRLPYYGALVTFSRYDKKYEAGLYRVGGTYMYVNRGVGMEGGRAPRVRFLDRPEITVIDVIPE